MPSIDISPDYDGYSNYLSLGSTWSAGRAASSATFSYDTATTIWIRTIYTSARGSTLTSISRGFFEFDVSGITTCTSATLYLRRYGGSLYFGNAWLFKATQTTNIGNTDYDEIDGASTAFGNSDGAGGGVLTGSSTPYSDAITSWGTSSLIELKEDAINDINSSSSLKIGMMGEPDVDDDASLGTNKWFAMYSSNHSTSSYRPVLTVTYSVATADDTNFFGINF